MASAVSYELFIEREIYLGQFATSAALIAAFPAASLANYAYVDETTSYWYWNANLTPAAWVNQQIPEAEYIALTASEKAGVPYIVTP